MSQLAANLKAFRTNNGLTQAELAELISRDSSLICKMESGQSNGSLPTLTKLAEVLGVTVGALLGESGPPSRVPRSIPDGDTSAEKHLREAHAMDE